LLLNYLNSFQILKILYKKILFRLPQQGGTFGVLTKLRDFECGKGSWDCVKTSSQLWSPDLGCEILFLKTLGKLPSFTIVMIMFSSCVLSFYVFGVFLFVCLLFKACPAF